MFVSVQVVEGFFQQNGFLDICLDLVCVHIKAEGVFRDEDCEQQDEAQGDRKFLDKYVVFSAVIVCADSIEEQQAGIIPHHKNPQQEGEQRADQYCEYGGIHLGDRNRT